MSFESAYIALAALSAALSLLVVMTGLFWPNYMLSKNRPFSTVIFFISLCDFCGSIINCLGFPQNGTDRCNFQAFGYLYFIPASWLWTVMLVYQLRTLIIFKRIQLSLNWMHFICWGVAFIPALLPLSTNPYGQDDSLEGNSPCAFGGNSTSKFLWITTCDTGIAFLCFVLMTVWCGEIVLYLSKESGEDRCRETSLFQSMRLYPVALFVTWVPTFFIGVFLAAGVFDISSLSNSVIFFVIVVGTQYGSLLSVIYFSQSSVARQLWLELLRRNCPWLFASRDDLTVHLVTEEADRERERGRLSSSNDRIIISKAGEDDEDVLVMLAISRSASRSTDSTRQLSTNVQLGLL